MARPARRHCPALDRLICSVCCGTKRLSEIRCPDTCGFLATAQAHPPAQIRRQQRHDFEALTPGLAGLSEPLQQLFLFSLTLIQRFRGEGLDAAIDADVVGALEALASTYETEARGLIYEPRAASAPAQRLAAGIREVFDQLGKGRPSGFAAEAAEVLRRLADRVRAMQQQAGSGPRAFLDLAGRVAGRFAGPASDSGGPDGDAQKGSPSSPIILP